jgi:Pyruvate:ferredoxin oxidoreductase and related 2-oxoacid:ferredoxin oxidoreductases, gamma subunit
MVASGGADVLIALEPAEALRFAHFLSPNGVALINTMPVLPVTVTTGAARYPPLDEILAPFEGLCRRAVPMDATAIAKKAGTAQAMNVVMLGALARYIPLKEELILEALCDVVPPKFLDANKKAFSLGKAEVE